MAYELRMTEAQRKRFIQIVKDRMKEKGISVRELVMLLNYAPSSIYPFLGYPDVKYRFLAAAIADALEIERKEWR